MATIIVVETGESITVASAPTWSSGVWDCGDQRFTDAGKTLYVPGPDVQAPASWDLAPAEYFWIDVGPFFDRFGTKAIDIMSSTDPLVDGMVKMTFPRKYIDLKRADLPQLVGILVSKGIITQSLATTVLNPETTDYERNIKGLPQPLA